VDVALADPEKRKRRKQGIEEAAHIPGGAPAPNEPGPFVEHQGRNCCNRNGKDIAANDRGKQCCDNEDDPGKGPDREVAHRPPKWRSRAAYVFNAWAKVASSKSGQS